MKKIIAEDSNIRYEELTDEQYPLAVGVAGQLGCGIEYGSHRYGIPNFNVTLFNENRTEAMVEQFEAALAE